MPGKIKVQILAGRDLPVMDRANNSTDAFVEIKFGSMTFKTDVCRRSLDPVWNSEWYRFEVDDEDLQDEMLQIRVFDHDTYSAHDAIGKVYIDLNPLLMKDRAHSICGWFPIYDTMHGIRGELKVVVKLELFSDFNKFRQSSCGVKFFYTSGVPVGYTVNNVYGFVEELVVNDDPEYDWIDKIRSMRASNEARQIQFSKLSGELQRKIGLKVLEMGGNGVIGYRQCIDLEGETGVVVRCIGTAVSLYKQSLSNTTPPFSLSPGRDITLPEEVAIPSSPTNLTPGGRSTYSPAKAIVYPYGRRSSDSDIGTPPKGGSLGGSGSSGGGGPAVNKLPYYRPLVEQDSIDMLVNPHDSTLIQQFVEYPFFTIKSFPPGFLVHIGGVVSARSVKLLDKIRNPDEPETRDTWWTELRTEIRSHARALGCHAVVGYSEETSICEEVIVLSACGTAAIVNLNLSVSAALTQSLDRQQFDKEKEHKLHVDVNLANQAGSRKLLEQDVSLDCSLCHIPYKETSLPFKVNLTKCAICRKAKVPDVLFTTIECPVEMPIVGMGCLIQARIIRQKKDGKGETNAREISDSMPFMEIELHNQLINKLKMKGMNTLHGLKIQFTVGECLLVAVATATGVFSAPIPPPPEPRVLGKNNMAASSSAQDLQRRVEETINRNKEIYGLNMESIPGDANRKPSITDESEEETLNDAELSNGDKDTFVLEIDDAEDAQSVSVLVDPVIPEGFYLCNTETVPGMDNLIINLQMFTIVWRDHLRSENVSPKGFALIFDSIIRSMCFKLRSMKPCALCKLSFDVDVPEEDEIQVTVTGMCVGLGEPKSSVTSLIDPVPKQPDKSHKELEDMMFQMEINSDSTSSIPQKITKVTQSQQRMRYHNVSQVSRGIEITPLAYIPNARIDQYLGHLNFFLIRETTSVKEEGGLNGFLHSFIAQIMAVCRAHVACLGGNSLISYRMSECVLDESLHKNQSHCLINFSGDICMVTYGVEQWPLLACVPVSAGVKATNASPQPQDPKQSTYKHSPYQSPGVSPKTLSPLSI